MALSNLIEGVLSSDAFSAVSDLFPAKQGDLTF